MLGEISIEVSPDVGCIGNDVEVGREVYVCGPVTCQVIAASGGGQQDNSLPLKQC